mmetsp:Transcript_27611/g.41780  ORF Transcript_27611/g.41780 Transcript_27611/m.41780 type:complete len:299 (+) Transcript_27611:189-1085(+)
MLLKAFLIIFGIPVLASLVLDLVFQKPPADHGKGTMFDLIATRYDFINRALALNLDIGWRKTLIAEVTSHGDLFEQHPLVKVLDLATGTADVAILMAKGYKNHERNTNELSILGVDPSRNMIEVGRNKVSKENLANNIKLDLGDARDLRNLSSDEFHAATMSFGIRNVPEKETALCEIHRVLQKEKVVDGQAKQGAKLGILEFSEPPPDSGIMGAGARLFIRYVVPVMGAVLSGAPKEYMHLQNSIKDFPSPKKFVTIMESLNCGKDGEGSFRVDNLVQMNFGSVQLYLATPILKKKD